MNPTESTPKGQKDSQASFRVFSRSHLLGYTTKVTHASDDYPGVLHHYEVATLNHIVDVIATKPPRIAVDVWKGKIQ